MMNDNEIPFGNDNAETENNTGGRDNKSSQANYTHDANDGSQSHNDLYKNNDNRSYGYQRERNRSTSYHRDGQNYNRDGQNYRQNNYNRDGQNYNRDGQNYNRDGQNYRQNNYNRDGQNYNRDGQNYRQNNYNRDGQNYRQNNYNRDGQGNYGSYQEGDRQNNQYQRRGNQQFRSRNGGGYQRNNARHQGGNSPRHRNRPSQPPKRLKRPQPRRQRLTPLVKALRSTGFASPRICVEIIRSGRVFVNNELCNNPNISVNTRKDMVSIDGVNINETSQNVYLIINKQKNIVGSNEDVQNSIYRQFKSDNIFYFPFGCLEKSTSGLVFATTDPKFKSPDNEFFATTPIEYTVKVNKALNSKQISELSSLLSSQTSANNTIEYLDEYKRHSWIKCRVINTKSRILRKFLKDNGLEILNFERSAIGSLSTDVLQRGMWTRLTNQNVEKMLNESILTVSQQDSSTDDENDSPEHDTSLRHKVRSLYRNWFK